MVMLKSFAPSIFYGFFTQHRHDYTMQSPRDVIAPSKSHLMQVETITHENGANPITSESSPVPPKALRQFNSRTR